IATVGSATILVMARIARAIAVGCAHHVTQRGTSAVTFSLMTRIGKLTCIYLADAAGDARMRVLGFCLMTNHVHLIVVPERPDSMATAFRKAHANYSRWLNVRLRRCGHVWQNRYFSLPARLRPSGPTSAMRYVEFESCASARCRPAGCKTRTRRSSGMPG
ncbi:MAG: transposase, partial [Bryobacterales bacterium]|nr:transposase [Bryobacterales bacterium]